MGIIIDNTIQVYFTKNKFERKYHANGKEEYLSLKYVIFFMALWTISMLMYQVFTWVIVLNAITIVLLWRYRTIDKQHIFIGVVLGSLCMLSNVMVGCFTILPLIASMTVFKHSAKRISFYKRKAHSFAIALLLIVIVGGLGSINVLLAMGSIPMHVCRYGITTCIHSF